MLKFLLFLFLFLSFTTSTYAQQGCCSYHGGIDYCDSSVGRYVCNDGFYSPTCGCYQAPAQRVVATPTPRPVTSFISPLSDPKDQTINYLNKNVAALDAQNVDLRAQILADHQTIFFLGGLWILTLIGMALTQKYPLLAVTAQWILGGIIFLLIVYLLNQ